MPRHLPSVKNVSEQVRSCYSYPHVLGVLQKYWIFFVVSFRLLPTSHHTALQGISHTNARIMFALTSHARRARHNSKIHALSLNQRRTDNRPSTCPRNLKTSSYSFFLFFYGWLRVMIDRSGTANRILEAKEKQREKEKEKTDRATKRAKRYGLSSSSSRVIFPTPFYNSTPLSATSVDSC